LQKTAKKKKKKIKKKKKKNPTNTDAGHGGHPEKLAELGGVESVMKTLSVDTKTGLTDATVANHKEVYGINALPERRFRGFHEFWMDALEDRVIVILIVAAVASLILGVTTHDPETGWIEGFAIFVAVLIVTLVSSFNDFSKDRKFRKLEAVKDDRKIKVLRNGSKCEVSTYDLVAGDIMFLSTGDWIPADLCVLTAHSLAVDESAMTGEPDAIKKNNDTKPFCFSGTKVMEGEATCLVMAVGVSSQWGVLQMALRGKMKDETNLKWPHNKRWLICPKYPEEEDDGTPLQQKLARLADQIGVFGLSVAVLIFLILLIKWGIGLALNDQLTKHKDFSSQAAGEVLDFFLTAVTILVVAVPEGLPLAVTIALAYSQRKMMKDNNLVRVLAACETMGGATQITTDKTGTLTQNRMTVVKGYVGDKFNEDSKAFADNCKDAARRRFSENISVNSTAFISRPKPNAEPELVGSKTECALLLIGEEMSIEYEKLREAYKNNIVHLYPFASAKKTSGVVLSRLNDDAPKKKASKKNKEAVDSLAAAVLGEGAKFTYYVKGASEIVLLQCDRIESPDGSAPIPIDKKKRAALDQMIIDMASSGLRTLCLGYIELDESRNWEEQRPESGMVLQCIVGIKDPVRKEVPAAVKDCQIAGVKVRMVTGDNVLTASHIGRECGILSEKGVAMIGPDFRKLSNAQLDPLLSGDRQLEVIARCSPLDKQRLVSRLQKLGEVVASTGDGTNDAPQLKMADVGFAMGIAGTEVAKEACDIILMDDNFSSVVKALIWGRNVFDSIRKFLQFQLTVNVGALIVAVIGALGVGESPLTAVQLLWVNLIMDTMAALALATELPSRKLLERKPYGRYEALITTRMWRFILAHASYQVIILLVLLFEMRNMFWFHDVDPARPLLSGLPLNLYPWCLDEGSICADLDMPRQDTTVIFNTFVLMQVFNEFNARFLEDEINIFAGIFTNHIFWIVIVITLGLQGIIVEFGWRFTQTAHLNGLMWAGCFVIGVSEIPYGLLLRFVPVPEVCCIKALARTEPIDDSDDDEAGPGLDFEPQPEDTSPAAAAAASSSAKAAEGNSTAAAATTATAAAAASSSGSDGTAGQKRLKPDSHWRKAQEIHTTVSVVNAFRRSGRKQ
jgi:magnesium-transporting ATPase (P-type)